MNLKSQDNKSFSTKKHRNKQTQFNSSITGVNPIRTHGFGVYRGKRKVWSVRVDEKLLKQAKPVLKAKFGSECRGVEAWLAALVATTQAEQLAGVYPSNTVEIGKLVVERNLRPRRKLEWEAYDVGFADVDVCGYCGQPFSDVAFRVEYVSHKFDVLCPGCYKYQNERDVVDHVVSRLVPKWLFPKSL